jgi:hypothetical protein
LGGGEPALKLNTAGLEDRVRAGCVVVDVDGDARTCPREGLDELDELRGKRH